MGEDRRDDAIIEVEVSDEKLASSIQEKMSNINSFMCTKCCIFKVPNIILRHNFNAYVPNAFSIGPLHHGESHLEATEKIKLQYLHGLISRAPTPETSLKNFISAIREREKDARDCYAVQVEFSVDEFIKILVLDGCFIIELFRKVAKMHTDEDVEDDEVRIDEDDPIFNMACMFQFLHHDLILLQNQVPWFVLERLFSMTSPGSSRPQPKQLDQLAICFFDYILSSTTPLSKGIFPGDGSKHTRPVKEPKHILHLLRKALVSSFKEDKEEDEHCGKWLQFFCGTSTLDDEDGHYDNWQQIFCARILDEAGIRFRKSNSKFILDIKFRKGVLEMPPLSIQETTETILRNLISFEQCYHDCKPKITSYAILLDNLINTSKDMDLLCHNKIIDNWLNPEEATQFFNKLYHDTSIKKFYYKNLCKRVNKYCGYRWPRWRAMYVRNYFSTPWAIVSQIVAAILLTLAIVQTVYSII